MCLLNLFTAEASGSDVYSQGGSDRNGFIKNGLLNMDLVLKKFVEYFTEICSEKDAKFVEKYGRKFFLLYLKPIINGTGNYYLEAQTRDERRTDVIVDYLGEQFIIELKIWHGSEYNERGEQQRICFLANCQYTDSQFCGILIYMIAKINEVCLCWRYRDILMGTKSEHWKRFMQGKIKS